MEKMRERRTAERRPVRLPVKYFYVPPEVNPPPTYTVDLSVGGACIETLDPLQPGASVAFFILAPEHQVIDARAQVVHTQSTEGAPYRAGVRFLRLPPADRALLERTIKSAAVMSDSL
ncbi:MAG: PilZ domain-containing protein [Chloroflexota bacterium]|nr:PilZ domain-containing protein [Chloroflexota bacterium]